MKIKYFFTILIIVIICAFIVSCTAQKYNFDYDPPYINARLDEVFPSSIKQTPRCVEKLEMPENYQGFKATYTEGKITMRVIKCPDETAAQLYFGSTIVEEFKQFKTRSYDNVDGRWKASGTDENGRRWLGWVNHFWIFVLSGEDDDSFDLVVRACRFVSKAE